MRLGRRTAGVLVTLAVIAAFTAATVFAAHVVIPTLSLHGHIAIAVGTAGVCLLAGALMFLMFHSSRHGWDDVDEEP